MPRETKGQQVRQETHGSGMTLAGPKLE